MPLIAARHVDRHVALRAPRGSNGSNLRATADRGVTSFTCGSSLTIARLLGGGEGLLERAAGGR
jgi:hypothetical protein